MLGNEGGASPLSQEELDAAQQRVFQLLGRSPLKEKWVEVAAMQAGDLYAMLQQYGLPTDGAKLRSIQAHLAAQWDDPEFRRLYIALVRQSREESK